jgi:hypothetical protein
MPKWFEVLDDATLIDALIGEVEVDLTKQRDERSKRTQDIVNEILKRLRG